MKPTVRKKDIFSDNRRLETLFLSDKINQVIQQAKKNVDDFIENSQKLAFEVCIGDAVSEIYSGDAISQRNLSDFLIGNRFVCGGDKVSTGVVDTKVACRGVRWPRKTAEKQLIADEELALAAQYGFVHPIPCSWGWNGRQINELYSLAFLKG